MSTVSYESRIKGALWGLLIGDALGSPLQFGPMRKRGEYVTEMEPCEVFDTPKGCWTDDGSLALCIMDSFLHKGYDLRDIGETFYKWQENGYLSSMPDSFDEGLTTRRAIDEMHRTGKLFASPGSETSGSIMRFAPSYFIGKYEERDNNKAGRKPSNVAEKVALEISDLTHTALGCRREVSRMVRLFSWFCEGKEMDYFDSHGIYEGNLEEREHINTSGLATTTLNAALWAFWSTGTFEEALIEAVNLGGDSDTIGAVCGQIAGCYYGVEAIPKRWIGDMAHKKFLEDIINRFTRKVKM